MVNFSFILERLSSRAKNALIAAQMLSEELHHDHIGTEHLLYGVVAEKSSFGAEILSKAKVGPENVRKEIIGLALPPTTSAWKPVLSENLKTTIERSATIASRYGYQFIGTEHFLAGLIAANQNRAAQILRKLGLDTDELNQNLNSVFENIASFPEMPQMARGNTGMEMPETRMPGAGPQNRGNSLDYFAVDLTKKAQEGKVDPVIGRKKELERMISILSRRTKNNPVLIGEAGVGKTAIVEGLALAISKKEVPDSLLDKKILSLDLALVVAGSMFRGEFENRLKQIVDEVKANPNIILFIDELHTLVGAGATTGSLDAANILKPALARGEMRAIGATTLAEYKKHIEHDAALERRFQSIMVEEPSVEESIEILKGLRPSYEKHHNVAITDGAINAAVNLSSRYIQDHFLPDKAVDLVDETAAFLRTLSGNSKLLRAKKQVEESLSNLEQEKTKAVLSQDFTTALHLRTQEDKLLRQMADLEAGIAAENQGPAHTITDSDIAHTVSMMTKIPLDKLTASEVDKLSTLEKVLQKHIIGQDDSVKDIAKSIRRSRAGLQDPSRPLGSFIFLGPTGVGKTETAKVIAREVFGSEEALVRVDMSEFMERHNVARLIGAPAGYVGYEEGGRLTEAVRRKPYSVVLFDEIEKAHPDVFNVLLQVLEDGQLTDASGKKVSFRNTVIIMTSNLGVQELNASASRIGFADKNHEGAAKQRAQEEYDELKKKVQNSVKEFFRPEFLNRIDKILIFRPLGLAELRKIAVLQISDLQKRMTNQGLALKTTPALARFIGDKSFDPAQGARFIRRNIQELIEDQLAEKIISGQMPTGSTVLAQIKDEKVDIVTTMPEVVPA